MWSFTKSCYLCWINCRSSTLNNSQNLCKTYEYDKKFFLFFGQLLINGTCISLNNDLNNSSDFLFKVGGSLPVNTFN